MYLFFFFGVSYFVVWNSTSFFQSIMYARRSHGRSGRSYRRVTRRIRRPIRSGSRRTGTVKRAMGLKNRSRSLNTNPNQVYRVVVDGANVIMLTAGNTETTTT